MRILLFCLVCFPVFSQDTWVKVLEQEGKVHLPSSMIVNNEGNILAAGGKRNDSPPLNLQPFIACFTPQGQALWSKTIALEGTIWEILELEGGDLAILYSHFNPQQGAYIGYYLMRLSNDGIPLWSIKLKDYSTSFPSLVPMGEDIIVRFFPTGSFDNFIFRIDPSGLVKWAKCLKSEGLAGGLVMIPAIDEGLFFYYKKLSEIEFIAKMDGEGNLLWARHFLESTMAPVTQFRNGDLLLFGNTNSSLSNEGLIARINQEGEVIWSKLVISPYDFYFLPGAVILENGAGITGIALLETHKSGILRFDPTGEIEWIKMFQHFSSKTFSQLAMTNDQSVFFLQRTLWTPFFPIIKTTGHGQLEDCSFQELCFSTLPFPLTPENYFPAITDTMLSFAVLENFSSFPEEVTLTDFCPACPFPTPYFAAPDTICVGECFRLDIPCNLGAKGYSWIMAGAEPSSSSFPNPGNVCYRQPGVYTITYIINTETCPDTFSRQIVIVEPIEYDLGKDTLLCEDPPVLYDAFHPRLASWFWENGDTIPEREISTSGIYAVTVTDLYCNTQYYDDIHIQFFSELYPEPPIDLGNDTTVCEQLDFFLDASHPDATRWWWNDGSTEAVIPVKNPGTYQVTAWLRNCPFSDIIHVESRDCSARIFAPNAFSPNGDGVNDFFSLHGKDFETKSITIFNRWGEIVYKGDQILPGWDGRAMGKPAPAGVYVYLVQYIESLTGRESTFSGDVLLVR